MKPLSAKAKEKWKKTRAKGKLRFIARTVVFWTLMVTTLIFGLEYGIMCLSAWWRHQPMKSVSAAWGEWWGWSHYPTYLVIFTVVYVVLANSIWKSTEERYSASETMPKNSLTQNSAPADE